MVAHVRHDIRTLTFKAKTENNLKTSVHYKIFEAASPQQELFFDSLSGFHSVRTHALAAAAIVVLTCGFGRSLRRAGCSMKR